MKKFITAEIEKEDFKEQGQRAKYKILPD